jgi:glycosyltransferase involved in cell wall biosynthesis
MVCGSGFMAETGIKGEWRNGIRRGMVDGIDVIEINLVYSNYDSLPKRALVFLKYALKSTHVAWKEKYDVLFATSTPLTAGIPGIFMRLLKPQKIFIFEVRDLWPELPKAAGIVKNPFILLGLEALEKLSYWAMHAGIALSPGILKGMKNKTAFGKEVALIPNGCDLDLFLSGNQQKNMGAIPEIPQTGLRCIFIGTHGISNGLDAVLDAAKILKKADRSDIYLIFIGDGMLKPHLKKRALNEGLTNCIFLDPIPKKHLTGLLCQVDVGMMILKNVPAFYWGTSPNKFFDYLSSGLPVVNNYPGWVAEIIKQNKCGVVVPPDVPESFASSLIEMADHRESLKIMAQNSRNLAEKEFARGKLADQFVSYLEKIYDICTTP